MKEQIFQVDAFTNKPFAGNPAGVVLLTSEKSDDWMRSFAREMNLSETAFLLKVGDGYSLRWFTPKVEVSLCGHATLASAHVLFSEAKVPGNETILFSSASGVLEARFEKGWIELDFPAFEVKPVSSTPQIDQVIGFSPSDIFESDVNLLVELESFDAVRDYQPDFLKIAQLPYQGLIITCRMDAGFDFASRYFAPRAGIDEDPVTGSAHCSLTPYWAAKLETSEFNAYQASERTGELKVKLDNGRVLIQGQAVTIFKGELEI